MITIIRNFAKTNLAVFFSALVTLTLFYVMQLMVTSYGDVPKPQQRTIMGPLTIPDEPLIVTVKEPIPEEMEEPMPSPPIERPPSGNIGEIAYTQPSPPAIKTLNPYGEGLIPVDAGALALVQVQPIYPNRALARGIEGYVLIEFNINKVGSVVDPQILFSEPSGIFDREALKAISRWKYNPSIVNGKEVKVFGIRQKMVFTLEE